MDAPKNDRDRPLVVITGGLGRVGTVLRPYLRRHHKLRIVDTAERADAVEPEPEVDIRRADIGEPDAAYEFLNGADAILHLAGDANPWHGWEDVYRANVRPMPALLQAAAAHAVPKIVLASSLHAAGEYNRPVFWPVSPRLEPKPCCAYGLSKVVVEALGRSHAERTGASVTCLRLGLTGWPLTERRYLGMWLSDGDAARLVLAALCAREPFGVHFGVSANSRRHWDTASAQTELGYRPQDDSELYADSAGPASGPVCRIFDDSSELRMRGMT
ncbi:NAD-dependent epimerase/dehydratase family protein [Nonomuraea sp. CA-141351]|uniref:NAD-dependent epimerase/dehydratase family protein n=1 Tax=Nonomuraea sp. CA-141351 TaxID=3239996 RepID=UPI003D94FCA5